MLKPKNVNSKVALCQVDSSDLKDKTLSKIQNAKVNYSERTLSNYEG
jgi:hypothetical protein